MVRIFEVLKIESMQEYFGRLTALDVGQSTLYRNELSFFTRLICPFYSIWEFCWYIIYSLRRHIYDEESPEAIIGGCYCLLSNSRPFHISN